MKRYSKYFLFFVLLALICAGCSNAADSSGQAKTSLNQVVEEIETASSDTYEIDVSVTGKLTRSDIFLLSGALSYNPTVYVNLDLSGAEFTTVPRNAFYVVSMLTNIAPPDTVTVIEEGSFESAGLASIDLPPKLTDIKEYAFIGTRLTSVTIPGGLTFIGSNDFNTDTLSSVTLGAAEPPAVSFMNDKWSAFGFLSSPDLIRVPSSAEDAYKTADGWREYADCMTGSGT